MKTLLLFSCCLSLPFLFMAQSDTLLKGSVSDPKGNAIFAANVYCKNSPEKGTTTGFDGIFRLELTDQSDTLVISYIGYNSLHISLSSIEQDQFLDLTISESAQEMSTVFVQAKTPISEQYAVRQLEKLEIYLNPLSQGDPLKATTTLPSSTTDDESASPSLRGSSEDRSRVILNGVPIYRPVRNTQFNGIGNFSIFNTELVDKLFVYASNPPLTYGNTSAGLIEIETTKKLESNQIQLSATLASVGAFISQKLNEKVFVQAFSNLQFAEPFLALNRKNLERLEDFRSTDAGLNVHYQISNQTTLNSITYAIDEGYEYTFQLFTHEDASSATKRRLFSVNSLKHSFEQAILRVSTGLNFSKTNFSFGNLQSKQHTKQVYTAVDYKHFLPRELTLQGGLSIDYQKQEFDNIFPLFYYAFAPETPTSTAALELDNTNLEGYLYGTWKPASEWLYSLGIRKNIPLQGQQSYWSAQGGIRFQPNNRHSWLLSGGQYHSYTTPGFNIQDFRLLSSQQVALDYTYARKNTELSAAIFIKKEKGDQAIDNFLNTSESNIFGLECAITQQMGKYLQLNLANTFLNHSVTLEGRNYKGRYDFNYFAKASLQFMHPQWPSMSLSYIGRPGRYFTPITSATLNPEINFFEPRYSPDLFSGQFRGYNRIDWSMSKYLKFQTTSVVLFLNIANIFNFENEATILYNRDYSTSSFDYYTRRTIYFGAVWQFNS